ncbi:MAG: hypothetical protein Q7S12_03440 [bacterium]|nr:hypothetical protein [bacterium]
MKELIFAIAICAMLSAGAALADDYPVPQLPPKENFLKERESSLLCGKFQVYVYVDQEQTVAWILFYLGDIKEEFIIQRKAVKNGKILEDAWLRVNRGEHVYRHFSSLDAIEDKYPSPCDALTPPQ